MSHSVQQVCSGIIREVFGSVQQSEDCRQAMRDWLYSLPVFAGALLVAKTSPVASDLSRTRSLPVKLFAAKLPKGKQRPMVNVRAGFVHGLGGAGHRHRGGDGRSGRIGSLGVLARR